MRDFRVTTIFEGTTEIHSIYPPMFVLRNLNKQVAAAHRSTISKTVFFLKSAFTRSHWKLRFNNRVMNRTVRLVKANARSIRWLLHAGMLLYGKKIHQRQFLLRRITNLSLYLYGLVSVLAKVHAAAKRGREVSEDLRLLAYFLEEARQARRRDKRLFPSRQESLHRKIFKDVKS
jgi:acyl-CoA dehydrogenase family protein 9